MDVLTVVEWEALEGAEQVMYAGIRGMLPYTEVTERDRSHLAAVLWSHADEYVAGNYIEDTEDDDDALNEVAHRVAHALATLAFGVGALPVGPPSAGGVDSIGRGDLS
jgi:hypothetical protein